MDPEYVLKWVIGVASLVELCTPWLGFPKRALGWRGLALGLLLILGLDYWLRLPGAAYALLLVWCLLVGLPSTALRQRQRALRMGQLPSARRWARLVAWLHPLDEQRNTAALISARALAAEGRVNEAHERLQRLEKHATFGELARLEGLLLEARWSVLVERLEQQNLDNHRIREIAVQAFGETGELQRMLSIYAAIARDLTGPARVQLEVAAYLGSVSAVDLALAKLPAPPEVAAYFRGVALQVAGDRLLGRPLLQDAETHPAWQRSALARLRRPLEPLDTRSAKLRERATAALEQLCLALEHTPAAPTKPWVTWSIAAVLLLVFLESALGASFDADKLIQSGALVLPRALAPEPWRVVTAGFLHASATHLALDLLLLLLLGSTLERLWGALALISCFLCANVGSYSIAAWLGTATPDRPQLILGASAGVFGLLGALVAFDAVGYAFERSRLLLRRVLVLLLLMFAQVLFDSFTPIVGSSLHLTGAALGFLVACPQALRFWRRQRP